MWAKVALAKVALLLGAAVLFFGVSGALSVSIPTYSQYFYFAAGGLSLIAAGLISMTD